MTKGVGGHYQDVSDLFFFPEVAFATWDLCFPQSHMNHVGAIAGNSRCIHWTCTFTGQSKAKRTSPLTQRKYMCVSCTTSMAENTKLLKTSSALQHGGCAVGRENGFPSATEAFDSSRELYGFRISTLYNPEGYFVCHGRKLEKNLYISCLFCGTCLEGTSISTGIALDTSKVGKKTFKRY